jgi:hypothetical protein
MLEPDLIGGGRSFRETKTSGFLCVAAKAYGHYKQESETNQMRIDSRPTMGVTPISGTGPLVLHRHLHRTAAARKQDAVTAQTAQQVLP